MCVVWMGAQEPQGQAWPPCLLCALAMFWLCLLPNCALELDTSRRLAAVTIGHT